MPRRAAELRARLQSMADDGGFNAAFVLLDRKSTADTLGPQEVELWRGRIRTRALEADSQRGVQVPVEVGLPPDANWNAAMSAFTRGNMAEAARRFELVADAPPDRASSWTLVRRLVLGGARQPAGRQSAEIRALSQARGAARPHLLWPGRAEGARHADRSRTGRCRSSIAAGPTCCATTAPASARSPCCSSAPRRRPSASSTPPRSTPIRSYVEAVLALAEKAALPGLSVRVGNANWDQRHKIKGYDGAMYPIPPWQPAGGFTVDRALVYGFMRQESAFNPKARSYVGAMGLMQLMPGTARLVATRYIPDHGAGNPYEPSTNVALGQAYIAQLLSDVDNNLVRTAAGYNGGPGNVMQWDGSLNAGQDPLLYIASIPLHETRDFVQRVLANYWIYQIRLGQPTPSLDQIAAHEWPRYAAQDTAHGTRR